MIAIILLLLVLYPFLFFYYLIYDGFNPYDELTYQEKKLEGGMAADIAYLLRRLLHVFLIVMLSYMVLMWVSMFILKRI